MGENDNYDFYEAMVDYKTGNYKMAINKWEKQLLAKPENDTLNYFLGSAYLAINKQEKAIDFFETISSDSNSIFKDDSYYYMALAQIRNMRIIDAKKSLLKSNHPKSQELLLKLKSE
jgi:tetratricopeptide (TPR) repeat protein